MTAYVSIVENAIIKERPNGEKTIPKKPVKLDAAIEMLTASIFVSRSAAGVLPIPNPVPATKEPTLRKCVRKADAGQNRIQKKFMTKPVAIGLGNEAFYLRKG